MAVQSCPRRAFAGAHVEDEVVPQQDPSQSKPQSPHDITRVLQAAQDGDPGATDELLAVVYDELRKLAKSRIAGEAQAGAGMTLQATALVHEAYLRLVTPPMDEPDRKAPAW